MYADMLVLSCVHICKSPSAVSADFRRGEFLS